MSRRDERTKLMATAFNNSGVATIAAGFIVPEITLPSAQVPGGLYFPYVAFAVGAVLILMGQFILGALEE